MSGNPKPGAWPSGLVIVDKPGGMTSHDVVARVRRLAHTRRVGHAGTLDPMATGVLVIGIEKATRLLGHLTLTEKTYEATIRLGQSTSTDDAEGEPTGGAPATAVTREALDTQIAKLTGEILQVPSSVSAIKVNGQRAYKLTRAGEAPELAARPVTIYEFRVTAVRAEGDHLDLDATVRCSSGTYIRALARDLGAALGTGGHLTALRRTAVGPYTLAQAHTLNDLEDQSQEQPSERVLALTPLAAAAAAAFPRLDLTADEARRLAQGARLPLAPARDTLPGLAPGDAAPDRPAAPVAAFAPDGTLVALATADAGLLRSLAVFADPAPAAARDLPGPKVKYGDLSPARLRCGSRASLGLMRSEGGRRVVYRWQGLDEVPADWGASVITIGVFDGVHRGHQHIVARAAELGRERGLPVVAITFDPHPDEVIRPGCHPPFLSSARRRAELLAGLGVDAVCVLPFTLEFSRLDPDEFVRAVLVEKLHAAAVVVGEDFRFGHKATGDVQLLQKLGEKYDFTVEGLPLRGLDGVTISSTAIRELLTEGDVAEAAQALGRPHRVEGVVVRGHQRGRQLGFPTANVESPPHTAIPADGIYAGWLATLDETGQQTNRWPAAISIGTNPTFDGQVRTVEAYAIDRTDLDLYGLHAAIDFAARLRGTLRFDSIDALVEQMHKDVDLTREICATQ